MRKLEQLKAMLAVGPVNTTAMHQVAIPSSLMCSLVQKGEAMRIARGTYVSTASGFSDLADYETLALMIPNGVFALQSALRLHELTDENPHEICMAIRHGFHPPVTSGLPVSFIYRTEPAFSSDIVEIESNGVRLRVYSVEQTIADCFQYRNKIGLDVAVSALREAVRKRRIDNGRLWDAVIRCRVSRTVRPYLEALI